jgi:hypothetical protein
MIHDFSFHTLTALLRLFASGVDDAFNLNPDMTLFICHHAWIGYGIRVRQYLCGYVTVAGVTPHTYMISHVCVAFAFCIGPIA